MTELLEEREYFPASKQKQDVALTETLYQVKMRRMDGVTSDSNGLRKSIKRMTYGTSTIIAISQVRVTQSNTSAAVK